MSRFIDALDAHLVNEFSASQQYIAIAVWYDDQTLPMLAQHFYRQAVEERTHAMIDRPVPHGRRRRTSPSPACQPHARLRRPHRAGPAGTGPGEGGHRPDRGARPARPRGGRPGRRAVPGLVPAGAARGDGQHGRPAAHGGTGRGDQHPAGGGVPVPGPRSATPAQARELLRPPGAGPRLGPVQLALVSASCGSRFRPSRSSIRSCFPLPSAFITQMWNPLPAAR